MRPLPADNDGRTSRTWGDRGSVKRKVANPGCGKASDQDSKAAGCDSIWGGRNAEDSSRSRVGDGGWHATDEYRHCGCRGCYRSAPMRLWPVEEGTQGCISDPKGGTCRHVRLLLLACLTKGTEL